MISNDDDNSDAGSDDNSDAGSIGNDADNNKPE